MIGAGPIHSSYARGVRRLRSALLVLVLALGAGGCERGCAGRGRATRDAGGFDLAGTDCSDGLVRCVEDRVEVSRLAHLPHPCGSITEGRAACVCPWDTVGRCPNGCAAPGLVAVGGADAGVRQLCRPDAIVARPVLPTDPAAATPRICGEPSVACRDGVVRVCEEPGRPERLVAVCLLGCEAGIAVDHGETVIDDGVAAILCRRDHAERR